MQYTKMEAKEAARHTFHGVWAAITTPFTPDGEDLDEAGLRRNMRHFIEALKVDGVFCTGTMGEFWSLTTGKHKRAVEIVVEEARGKIPVIAHTAHHSVRETVELTRHAEEVGADFAVLINPYYPPTTEEMVYSYFASVAERVNIGMWLFSTAYSGYILSPQLIARIAELPNVCGIKLGGGLVHYLETKRLVGDRLVLSTPSEDDWLMLMVYLGQRVHMSSASPYLYQTPGALPIKRYTELAMGGDVAGAAQLSYHLAPIRRVNHKWHHRLWTQQRIIPIAYIKAWSELLGLAAGPVRPPLLPLTPEEKAELRSDLRQVGLLQETVAP